MEGMRILVIEDNPRYSDVIVQGFMDLGASRVSTALDLPEAKYLLFGQSTSASLRYDIIVVDACVPGDNYNTAGIIRQLRQEGFDGVLVAASSLEDYRKAQLRDGCHIDGGPDKSDIPRVVSDELTRVSAL